MLLILKKSNPREKHLFTKTKTQILPESKIGLQMAMI